MVGAPTFVTSDVRNAAGGVQTRPVKSAFLRARSFNVRVWPENGSNTEVPVRNGARNASDPTPNRGEICKKMKFPVSGPWQPLQVLSESLWRASLLKMPGADQKIWSLKTDPAANGNPWN
jgi:hypothetical protein